MLPVQAQNRQPITLSGVTVSAEDESVLAGVNVVLTSLVDTSQVFGRITDRAGRFSYSLPAPGRFRIRFSFVGFQTKVEQIEVPAHGKVMELVFLEKDVVALDDVVVEAMRERVMVVGDTTIYNANAFQVNPDASAEDLVAKMPGVVVQDGSVQAQGEEVRRVLVDGREFFGEDPTTALRTLPAEIVEKIQVFDRLNDQAQFTGFDDGNTEKTINVITRSGRNIGQFGKLYGGYGLDDRYNTGGNVNVFDDTRRMSFIGLSNNINQQNFSTEDLLGVVGSAGRMGAGGTGMRGGGRSGGGRGGGGPSGGMRGDVGGGSIRLNSNPSNFMIGNQGGLNTTHSIGMNYSDEWGDKIRVTGSYFFNKSDNTTDVLMERQYILAEASTQFYNQTNEARSDNFNHRFSMRLQYEIDESNSVIFTPRLSTQRNTSKSFLDGLNTLGELDPLSRTINDYVSDNVGFTSSAGLLFRHRFAKRGRTFSTNLNVGANDRSGDTNQYSSNIFYDLTDSSMVIDQRTNSQQGGLTLSTNILFTEQIGEKSQLQINYSPSYSKNNADRLANRLDDITGSYSLLDPTLSNTYDNTTVSQRGGVSFMFRGEKVTFNSGLNFQDVQLGGDQTFPISYATDQSFRSLLPEFRLQFRFSRSNNLRFDYRTSTNTPSISQLQGVIDNTNPLQLSSGNPDLKQSYTHTLTARYNVSNLEKGSVFMVNASFSKMDHYIGRASTIATENIELSEGVIMAQGSQFTRPVNLDGFWNMRSFITLGLPFEVIKSNMNLNGGYTYSHTPGYINKAENISEVHNVNGGFVLGSNVSERLDFTLSYSMNYNIVGNSVYPELDANYLNHRSSVRFNWLPWRSIILSTNLNYSQYQGLDDSVDQNAVLWNVAFGYKFLKGNGGEVRLIVADLLNQNNNVSRTVGEFYVEDNMSNVLGRYIMLNFIYTLRNFRI